MAADAKKSVDVEKVAGEVELATPATVEETEEVELATPATVEETEEMSLVIRFKKPYLFEGKEYTEIDLSVMDDLTGSDMIAVNKIMARNSTGIDVMPEVSAEYACYFAARAAKLPVEFFMGLPPREIMKVKSRVMGFLFGSD